MHREKRYVVTAAHCIRDVSRGIKLRALTWLFNYIGNDSQCDKEKSGEHCRYIIKETEYFVEMYCGCGIARELPIVISRIS